MEFSSADATSVKKSSDAHSDLSQKCDLKSGERVMVQTRTNKIIQGTVKYVGTHEKNPQPGPLIGIELVSLYYTYICIKLLYMCMYAKYA